MKLNDVKQIALKFGVTSLGGKLEIIRGIQIAEGYQACFATRTVAECPEMSCAWRKDCFQYMKAKSRNSAR